MRVSDEDRRRVVEELRRHCAAGRIDVDEYATRVEHALAAGTFEELDQVRADLPMLRIADPDGRRHQVPGSLESRSERAGDARHGVSSEARLKAMMLAVITVAVVLAAIIIGLVAEWTWAIIIVVAWAVGLVQGRVSRRRRG